MIGAIVVNEHVLPITKIQLVTGRLLFTCVVESMEPKTFALIGEVRLIGEDGQELLTMAGLPPGTNLREDGLYSIVGQDGRPGSLLFTLPMRLFTLPMSISDVSYERQS